MRKGPFRKFNGDTCKHRMPTRVRGGEKSNITAKRVTLPLGFLSHGAKSGTARKACTPNIEVDFGGLNESTPSENLDELLNTSESSELQHSHSLSKKKKPEDFTASKYYLQVVSGPKSRKNSSKSIFKEIKRKYAESQQTERITSTSRRNSYKPNSNTSERNIPTRGSEINNNFSLSDKLVNFKIRDSDYFRQQILKEIQLVNEIFGGKTKMANISNNERRFLSDENKENGHFRHLYVPKPEWIFTTPPNRKLNFRHMQAVENTIKPAVLRSENDRKVVYEMNSLINVDLSHYRSKQEVPIDKRYMVEVSSSANPFDNQPVVADISPSEDDDEKMDLTETNPFELENHFLSLSCRPKKPTFSQSRIGPSQCKRQKCNGTSTNNDDTFAYVKTMPMIEESFTFEFTPSRSVEANTTGHIFDLDGAKKRSFDFQYEAWS